MARRAVPQAGFTLIEAVVGLSILLIGIMGLVAAIVTSLQAGRVAREHTIALAAAQEQMDDLITMTEVQLLAKSPSSTFAVVELPDRPGNVPHGEIVVDATEFPLYQVRVRVSWDGPYGDEQLTLDSTVLPE